MTLLDMTQLMSWGEFKQVVDRHVKDDDRIGVIYISRAKEGAELFITGRSGKLPFVIQEK